MPKCLAQKPGPKKIPKTNYQVQGQDTRHTGHGLRQQRSEAAVAAARVGSFAPLGPLESLHVVTHLIKYQYYIFNQVLSSNVGQLINYYPRPLKLETISIFVCPLKMETFLTFYSKMWTPQSTNTTFNFFFLPLSLLLYSFFSSSLLLYQLLSYFFTNCVLKHVSF